MADVKISALPAVTTCATTDIFALVQGGVTYRGTLAQMILAIPDADGSTRGLVTTGSQTIAGAKTFSSAPTFSSLTAGSVLFAGTGGLVSESNAQLFWDNANSRLGVGTATPGAFKIDVNGTARVQSRLTVSQDTTVTTEVCAVITTDTTNANLVLAPNGTGAIIADIPDGTTAGGNARGDNAVDLQMSRGNATRVASGPNSVISGGDNNTSSNTNSTVGGGQNNTASGVYSTVCGGVSNTASNNRSASLSGESNNSSGGWSVIAGGYANSSSASFSSVVSGRDNIASADSAVVIGGRNGLSYLYCQRSTASGSFAANSDAQTSSLTARRSITGAGIADLTLDGGTPAAGNRIILNTSSPGPTNARAWRAQIDLVAIVATAGGGGLVQNECFMGTYLCGIKRVGANTSLVGTVNVVNEVSDTNMATAVTTITADDTNEALKIEFTPPTTADGTTVIRVVATAYLTEVGR